MSSPRTSDIHNYALGTGSACCTYVMWSVATESINDFKHDYIAATSHFHKRNLKVKKSSLSYLEGALNVSKGLISPNLKKICNHIWIQIGCLFLLYLSMTFPYNVCSF